MPRPLEGAKQNKPLVRKASERKDVCLEMHTEEGSSNKEPSSKFRNEKGEPQLAITSETFMNHPSQQNVTSAKSISDLPNKMSNEHCGGHNSC